MIYPPQIAKSDLPPEIAKKNLIYPQISGYDLPPQITRSDLPSNRRVQFTQQFEGKSDEHDLPPPPLKLLKKI